VRNLVISQTQFFLSSPLRSYAIPLTVALASFILRFVADHTCSPYSDVCKKSSEFFSHVYAVVICFMLIVAVTKAQQVKELIQRIKTASQLLTDASKDKKD
jgi:hypothetical protein